MTKHELLKHLKKIVESQDLILKTADTITDGNGIYPYAFGYVIAQLQTLSNDFEIIHLTGEQEND